MKGRINLRFSILFVFSFLFFQTGMTQTCCSGGVPLAANLGLPPSNSQALQFRLSYDLNVLETLKSGRDKLSDNARSRRTHSALFEIGYSFSKRLSVDAFFSYVRQVREINQLGNNDITSTNGVGDGILLLKYKIYSSPDNVNILSTGLGIKAPIGKSDIRRDDGLAIVADLQPGSGAWDGIFWNQFIHQLAWRQSMSVSALATYSYKGENTNYLGSQTYRFGDELQLAVGLNDRLFYKNAIVDPSLEIRYRKAGKDKVNNNDFPNTSGEWVFISPGLSYWFNPDWSFNVSLTLPIYANIEGTQLTPSLRLNMGFYYSMRLK